MLLVVGAIVGGLVLGLTAGPHQSKNVPPEEEESEPLSLEVEATAYNSVEAQTNENPNEGAWGDEIRPGMKVVAVSPDLLEAGLTRGTELQIEGLDGQWTVLDRTASRHRNRIDIYMGLNVERAKEWGIREVTIHVFETDEAD